MNKKDILELKRRMKKDGTTFTRLRGCYVDQDRNKVTSFDETFLNLEDSEFFKYLDIAKKVLSGMIGNNLLELEFPKAEEVAGGRQQFLMGVRESALKNDALMDSFYDWVIDNYDYVGNYLILLFHDAYDVMTKTSDNNKLDESEEVYEYLLCAICPVKLSKPGLGYREDENRIGPRIRDWVVGVPDTGFIFPAFTDRSTDIHSVMFYTKDTKTPHTEFMESGLGCVPKLTSTEKKNSFQSIVKRVIGDAKEDDGVLMDIQEELTDMLPLPDEQDAETAPIVVTSENISDVLKKSGISDEQAAVIKNDYEKVFSGELPEADELIDRKLLERNEARKEKLQLVAQIEELTQRLENSGCEGKGVAVPDGINVSVKEEKEKEIFTQQIHGKRCIVIPIYDDEVAYINGVVKNI